MGTAVFDSALPVPVSLLPVCPCLLPTTCNTPSRLRYTFMAAVAGADLYEGLQQGAQLFVDWSISRYNQVANLQTVREGALSAGSVRSRLPLS